MTSSSREALVELLGKVVPRDEKEQKDLAYMLDKARTLSEPCSRTEAEAHFTGSAFIVDPSGERVCLIKHLKLNRWLQPGGHVEPEDEDQPLRAAIRETKEETDLDVRLFDLDMAHPFDIDVHAFPARGDQPGHWHMDLRFLCVTDAPEALRVNEAEAGGAEWVAWDEAIARTGGEPAYVRCLQKARELSQGSV